LGQKKLDLAMDCGESFSSRHIGMGVRR